MLYLEIFQVRGGVPAAKYYTRRYSHAFHDPAQALKIYPDNHSRQQSNFCLPNRGAKQKNTATRKFESRKQLGMTRTTAYSPRGRDHARDGYARASQTQLFEAAAKKLSSVEFQCVPKHAMCMYVPCTISVRDGSARRLQLHQAGITSHCASITYALKQLSETKCRILAVRKISKYTTDEQIGKRTLK